MWACFIEGTRDCAIIIKNMSRVTHVDPTCNFTCCLLILIYNILVPMSSCIISSLVCIVALVIICFILMTCIPLFHHAVVLLGEVTVYTGHYRINSYHSQYLLQKKISTEAI